MWSPRVYVIDYLIELFRLGPETLAAVTLPLHHTMGLNTQFLPTVLAGGRSLILATRLGLGKTYRNILESRATFVSLFADILGPLATEKNRRGLPAASSVTQVQLAGGMIQSRHLDAVRELFPAAGLHKGYGLTEAIRVSMNDDTDPRFAERGRERFRVSNRDQSASARGLSHSSRPRPSTLLAKACTSVSSPGVLRRYSRSDTLYSRRETRCRGIPKKPKFSSPRSSITN